MIEITKEQYKNLDGMRFVSRAISKDELRPQLTTINVTTWGAEATDGHRLHRLLLDHTWEPGLYRVIKNTKSLMVLIKDDTGMEYPNTDQIWPDETVLEFQELPSGNGDVNLLLKDVYRALPANTTINYLYVLDVVGDYNWTYAPPTEDIYKPIVFRNGIERAALIVAVEDKRTRS